MGKMCVAIRTKPFSKTGSMVVSYYGKEAPIRKFTYKWLKSFSEIGCTVLRRRI
jgi:hypothetical protein